MPETMLRCGYQGCRSHEAPNQEPERYAAQSEGRPNQPPPSGWDVGCSAAGTPDLGVSPSPAPDQLVADAGPTEPPCAYLVRVDEREQRCDPATIEVNQAQISVDLLMPDAGVLSSDRERHPWAFASADLQGPRSGSAWLHRSPPGADGGVPTALRRLGRATTKEEALAEWAVQPGDLASAASLRRGSRRRWEGALGRRSTRAVWDVLQIRINVRADNLERVAWRNLRAPWLDLPDPLA